MILPSCRRAPASSCPSSTGCCLHMMRLALVDPISSSCLQGLASDDHVLAAALWRYGDLAPVHESSSVLRNLFHHAKEEACMQDLAKMTQYVRREVGC